MNIVIAILVFVVVFTLTLRVAKSMMGEDKLRKKRVQSLTDTDEGFIEIQQDYQQERSSLAVALEGLTVPFRNASDDRESIELHLYQAGAASPDAVSYYIFFSTFGWIIGIAIFFLIYLVAQSHEGTMFWVILANGVFLAAMVSFGAHLWIQGAIENRKKILLRSFPDSLDLLLVCVESGLALDVSLARVCKELKYSHPEITQELNKTRLELTMLNDREKALLNLGKRTDLLAFKSLVAALLQSEKFGTSLVDTLRVLSDDYRQTRMMLAEEKAGKLPAKIAVYTIPLMLIALITLIISPAIIKALEVSG